MTNTANHTVPPKRSRHIWAYGLGGFVVVVVGVVAFWNWDWFVPLVNSRATAALGRPTTIQHLDVKLGRTTTIIATGVTVANADGLGDGKPFAQIAKLTVLADVMAYIHNRQIVLPEIIADQPVIEADQDASGKASWTGLGGSSSGDGAAKSDPATGPKIGKLVINEGLAHVAMAKLKADLNMKIATRSAEDGASGDVSTEAIKSEGGKTGKADAKAVSGDIAAPGNGKPDTTNPSGNGPAVAEAGGQIVVDANGTYSGLPITGHFVGGALLSLRDATDPYPIDLQVANGPTKVALTGTVQNPLDFAGVDLKLRLSGPNMELLTPLTGVPIPETPAYSIAGALDYADRKFKFTHFTGKVGSSDLNGDISVDPTGAKTLVVADLSSRQVDLTDLAGFIGGTPGHKPAAPKAESNSKVLPTTPINLPKLNMANIRLKYKGEHILGRSVPLDNIVANIDVTDGRISAKPISFAVGTGTISINTDLDPLNEHEFRTKTEVQFKRVDVGKLLAATGAVQGAGTISGSINLASVGNSMSTLIGHGDGGFRVGIGGGNLSALLVDLAGLQFGNALLSALGIPDRAQIKCLAVDMPLRRGILDAKTFLLDTSEARVVATGTVNLANETLDLKLKSDSKHFSIGTFPTPIDIGGSFRSPSIAPEAAPLALRAGAAIGLGVLFPPAALLPTIQFGIGEDNACQVAEAPIASQVNKAAGAPVVGRTARRPKRRHR